GTSEPAGRRARRRSRRRHGERTDLRSSRQTAAAVHHRGRRRRAVAAPRHRACAVQAAARHGPGPRVLRGLGRDRSRQSAGAAALHRAWRRGGRRPGGGLHVPAGYLAEEGKVMTTSRRIACALCACATIALHPSLSASSSSQHALGEDALAVVASWVAVDAVTGYERRVAPALAAALGWQADAYGNVVTSIGRGTPHRIVACALDRPGYAVSQIRDDGYLRLHRIGSGSRHPLWDQQFEAQQVRVMTKAGPVAGVVARANGHFGAQHRHETRVVTADDLWLDVGA